MAWYMYTGNRAQSVATGHGNEVVVLPYGKVEVHQLNASTQAMINRRLLKPCGAPPSVAPRALVVEGGAVVLQPTAFATWATELGVGRPGENVSVAGSGDTVDPAQPSEAGDAAAEGEGGKRRRR